MSIFEPSNVCNTLLWMATAGTMSSANIDRAEDTHKHCHSHLASCVSAGKSRVMLLLLPDGFDYRLTHRYLDSMPNTRRIMEEGYSGQILPFTSTWGNINFYIDKSTLKTHYCSSFYFCQHCMPSRSAYHCSQIVLKGKGGGLTLSSTVK